MAVHIQIGGSSAVEEMLSREGAGDVEHLEARQQWLQSRIASGCEVFLKVPLQV